MNVEINDEVIHAQHGAGKVIHIENGRATVYYSGFGYVTHPLERLKGEPVGNTHDKALDHLQSLVSKYDTLPEWACELVAMIDAGT